MTDRHIAVPPTSWDELADAEPCAQIAGIVTCWITEALFTGSTADRLEGLATRFANRLQTIGVGSLTDATPGDCQGFITAPTRRGVTPSLGTLHLRRVALRAIYRSIATLGGPDTDPTARIELPAKTPRGTRPCTPEELGLVRTAALLHRARRLHAHRVVALSEATATTGEIACIRWDDVDLTADTVNLPGAGPAQPRIGTLTEWGHQILASQTHRRSHDHVVASDPHYVPSQAAVVMLLRRVLTEARLDDTDLKPTSIRLTEPAAQLHAGGRIEDAAIQIGLTSLDVTARLLGWDWDQS